MRVQRVNNARLVESVLTEPALWEAVSEDDTGAPEDYRIDLDGMYAIALQRGEENELIGFMLGRHYTDTVVETHIAISPKYWGNDENVELGKKACMLLLEASGADKLVAAIPFPDKQVLRFAQRLGFQREGVNKKSFRRNGELLDQYYVGLTRE